MDKKNSTLMAVIAVATLLVAVIGATFAYFNVTATNSSNSSTATVSTGAVGSVALTQGVSNLYLDVNAGQMAQINNGTDYYGMATETTASTEPQEHVLATIAATGGIASNNYTCTIGYSMQISQMNNSSNSAYLALEGEDAEFIISSTPQTGSNNTAATIVGSRSLVSLKTLTTGTGTVVIHGNTSLALTGDVVVHNLNKRQNDLAELGVNLSFQITSFSCDTSS
jgi:hypothetical protein